MEAGMALYTTDSFGFNKANRWLIKMHSTFFLLCYHTELYYLGEKYAYTPMCFFFSNKKQKKLINKFQTHSNIWEGKKN